jgi:spore coat polysaccharide biosynthesis predicted glycosyltransferase SpsG/CMP-N-acetylneuraminic acid synthetase
MISDKFTVLIPALKKAVAFQDDLIKKLAGISLIQRAINKAVELGAEKSEIHLLTDSEEIRLIAERNGVRAFWDPGLVWGETECSDKISGYLNQVALENQYTLLLSPYAPLLTTDLINKAKKALQKSKMDLLKPVKQVKRYLYDENNGQSILEALFGGVVMEKHILESKAFTLFRTKLLQSGANKNQSILSWPVEHDLVEIESYQDWWVCEKLLNRKKIVFRVIGNEKVGMGHIYRALSLAQEISDHEITFVCEIGNIVALNKLASCGYLIDIYEAEKVVEHIITLKPDLVVNDILSTKEADVLPLQKHDIKVINFEDLGEGAKLADLTINELYDDAKFDGDNILWGHKYFFLRDEFNDAKPNCFKKRVDSVLLTFGGTDQQDLARKTYHAILELCKSRNIHIHIVTGAGYKRYDQLEDENKGESLVTLTKETGVISSIMEQSQLAIVSNGRTLYELAHMNIPAIVISQHKRETTHSFACEENGFIPIGLFEEGFTGPKIREQLARLLDDEEYRHQLFERTIKYGFTSNKKKVLKRMLALLPSKTGEAGC